MGGFSPGGNQPGSGGGNVGACLDLPSFLANAKPALSTVPVGASPNCTSCHANTNNSASGRVDMTKLLSADPMEQASACAQVRRQIDFVTPANSTLLLAPDLRQAGLTHPRKFDDAGMSDAFNQQITNWITAENMAQ